MKGTGSSASSAQDTRDVKCWPIHILYMPPRIGTATLPILPTGKWLLSTGKQVFVATDFPKVKLPPGNFNLNKLLLVNKNLKRLNQSWEIETYQKVGITCCLRTEFVLAPNPARNWIQCLKLWQDLISAALNVFFCILHLINSKAPWNTRKLSLHVVKNYFLMMKSLQTFCETPIFDFWVK